MEPREPTEGARSGYEPPRGRATADPRRPRARDRAAACQHVPQPCGQADATQRRLLQLARRRRDHAAVARER
eukprot:5105489-Prymnesium_polylepis.1